MTRHTRQTRHVPAVFAAFVAFMVSASAHGHVADKSFSTWTLDGTHARVSVRMRLPELANIPADTTPEAYLPANLVLMTDHGPAEFTAAVRQDSGPAEWAIYRWSIDTAGATPLAIESRLFADSEITHLHFARFSDPGGGFRERVLSVRDPTWPLEHGAAVSMSLVGYIGLGMHHILEGWDHLAFVIALLLLARSLKEVATLVTGFTIAHSITLGLATLGLVRPALVPVEIMIGFSIVLIAAENCWTCGGFGRV
ncbi:MAG: HupE/UreJ family protein, partial [Phycisphaerales bacterium]